MILLIIIEISKSLEERELNIDEDNEEVLILKIYF